MCTVEGWKSEHLVEEPVWFVASWNRSSPDMIDTCRAVSSDRCSSQYRKKLLDERP